MNRRSWFKSFGATVGLGAAAFTPKALVEPACTHPEPPPEIICDGTVEWVKPRTTIKRDGKEWRFCGLCGQFAPIEPYQGGTTIVTTDGETRRVVHRPGHGDVSGD